MIGHIRPQCPKLKREQNHVARSLPKKLSGPKHIVCHHFGAFGHLRPHCSKFQALKRIKRKEKLKLLGSCAMKAKPVLGENGKLLKKVFDVLTSLSMCIFSSHSSNSHLTFHEKLELLGRYAKKGKSVLSEDSMLLKKMFNALNSLTMCISGFHSSNPRLTSHETLIPNNRSVWMRKGSYGWAFALLVLDLILSIFVEPFIH